MPFTAQELGNITNAALDFFVKGPAMAQSIQDRPLLQAFTKSQKTFPGGKGNISVPVKGDYTTAVQGYSHNDTVSYGNPANIKRAAYPWKEIHAGIGVTLTELHTDGISVVDSSTSDSTTEHSDREMAAITNLLEDKLDDLSVGWANTFNSMLWKDGTQDAKQVPGLLSLLPDANATGTTGGLDRSATTWWRHRTLVGANKITFSTTLQTLTKTLRAEVRQLRRYGGKPTLLLCGSGFLAGLEAELAEKGFYQQLGFSNNGKNDLGISQISMMGAGDFIYDPTLDDLGYSKRCYAVDPKAIQLYVMEGEDMKTHNPARPYNQYALYRALTWCGGLVAKQLNGCGVYEIA